MLTRRSILAGLLAVPAAPAIVRAQCLGFQCPGALSGPSGGGASPYHADAVQLDGATFLNLAALAAGSNNGKFTFSGWLNYQGLTSYPVVWIAWPDQYDVYLAGASFADEHLMAFSGSDDAGANIVSTPDLIAHDSLWRNVLISCDTSVYPWLFASYITDVRAGDPIVVRGTSAFSPSIVGKQFCIGSDNFGDFYIGGMADPQWWIGLSIAESDNTITEANRRLFVSAAGKPVDPTVAAAALGGTTIAFSGDAAAWAAQATSQGFTISGALTNASSSPSD